jgi:hypothetical protein
VFGLLRAHRLIFDERCDAGGGVCSFAFRPEGPVGARAGQHGILGLSGTAMKPFSLATAPGEDRVLIGTSLASASAFKRRMAAADLLRHSGVAGRQIRRDKYLFYKPGPARQ